MKEVISLVLAISLVFSGIYVFFEPEILGAAEALTGVSLTVTGEASINCSSTAALSPNIPGQTGGTSTAAFGCVVTTNNSTGYNLKLKKNQKLQIADIADQRFDDYTTSTGPTDWNWDNVPNGAEEFGLCVNSAASTTDIVQKHRDNGADTCATSTNVTAWRCWHPIPTTPSDEEVANRTTATPAGGVSIIFGLQAQAGGNNSLQSGTYTCTTTATALPNP